MQMIRISIPVSEAERDALLVNAERNLRNPRDQARHLLRCALGLDSSQKDINPIYQTDFEQKEAV